MHGLLLTEPVRCAGQLVSRKLIACIIKGIFMLSYDFRRILMSVIFLTVAGACGNRPKGRSHDVEQYQPPKEQRAKPVDEESGGETSRYKNSRTNVSVPAYSGPCEFSVDESASQGLHRRGSCTYMIYVNEYDVSSINIVTAEAVRSGNDYAMGWGSVHEWPLTVGQTYTIGDNGGAHYLQCLGPIGGCTYWDSRMGTVLFNSTSPMSGILKAELFLREKTPGILAKKLELSIELKN